ncbi:hypothetical protein GGR51DRAFT_522888 [Nemania sp. FL0031]|nr:hypothetical protein GGR51DRAFT_522888 [Nemania sp. FL0031]
MPSHQPLTGSRRACDNCKRRKVKCNSAEICANCRVSNLVCEYTVVPKKRGPKVRQAPDHRDDDALLQQQQQHAQQDLPSLAPTDTSSPPQQLSPVPTDHSNHSPCSQNGINHLSTGNRAQAIYRHFLTSFGSTLPSVTIIDSVNVCIDLFMQYAFPTTPIIHEPSVRSHASALFSRPAQSDDLFTSLDEVHNVERMRAFALVTALCACISSLVPESILTNGRAMSAVLLHASRDMLRAYEDYDLECPDSTSLSIRDFHSTALQILLGKKGISNNVLGQADILALQLRLYSEHSVVRNNPVETRLLRFCFWHLYIADLSAAAFESRSYVLHEDTFFGGLTLSTLEERPTPLIDCFRRRCEQDFEHRLILGFHFIPRLYISAAALLRSLRSYDKTAEGVVTSVRGLVRSYLDFLGVMDRLPHWLQLTNIMACADDSDVVKFEKRSFWAQRCTLLMTFHCLRLAILQQCIKSGLWNVMGLSDDPFALVMKKIEIVSDFVQTMDDIPFIYHEIKGEAQVERIRLVGVVLLEIIENADNEAIKERAESYFARLLDTLARLNSKMTEEAPG